MKKNVSMDRVTLAIPWLRTSAGIAVVYSVFLYVTHSWANEQEWPKMIQSMLHMRRPWMDMIPSSLLPTFNIFLPLARTENDMSEREIVDSLGVFGSAGWSIGTTACDSRELGAQISRQEW